ncbi:BON domain-containing protein [Parasediminibacterium sp. JCM 36343]|uniref:BON domain-containing protein n=1 Tax=Parasediminibacterium sp. JCM 36343 TaxID=3374279 RepID=UPI003979BF30
MSHQSEQSNHICKAAIEHALKRNASMYDNHIKVEVIGNKAIISGVVESLFKKEEAGRVAWNTPGVQTVDNKLIVDETQVLTDE